MGQDVRKWYSVNVIGQTDTENNYRNQHKSILDQFQQVSRRQQLK
jgi:hypothetical protein